MIGGSWAGLVGGLVLEIVLLIGNIGAGAGPWIGMKGAGTPFLGERAHEPGFDALAILVGLLSHFAVSVVWGLLFAVLVYGATKTMTVLAGIAWGFVVWIGMHYVVLPVVGLGTPSGPVGMAILLHVLFGLAVALAFLPFQRVHPRLVAAH